MNLSPRTTVGAVAALLLCSSGCDPVDLDHPFLTSNVRIRDSVHVLDPAVTSNSVTEQDRIVFKGATPDKQLLKTGDIIVSGTGAGFLRKVVSTGAVSDGFMVGTTQASLKDAVVRANVRGSYYWGQMEKADPASTLNMEQLAFDALTVPLGNNATVTVQEGRTGVALNGDLAVQFDDASPQVVRQTADTGIPLHLKLRFQTPAATALVTTEQPLASETRYATVVMGRLPVRLAVTQSVSLRVSIESSSAVDVIETFDGQPQVSASTSQNKGVWVPPSGSRLKESDLSFDVTPNGAYPANATIGVALVVRYDTQLLGAPLLSNEFDVFSQAVIHASCGSTGREDTKGWSLAATAVGTTVDGHTDLKTFPATNVDVSVFHGEGGPLQCSNGTFCMECPQGPSCQNPPGSCGP